MKNIDHAAVVIKKTYNILQHTSIYSYQHEKYYICCRNFEPLVFFVAPIAPYKIAYTGSPVMYRYPFSKLYEVPLVPDATTSTVPIPPGKTHSTLDIDRAVRLQPLPPTFTLKIESKFSPKIISVFPPICPPRRG